MEGVVGVITMGLDVSLAVSHGTVGTDVCIRRLVPQVVQRGVCIVHLRRGDIDPVYVSAVRDGVHVKRIMHEPVHVQHRRLLLRVDVGILLHGILRGHVRDVVGMWEESLVILLVTTRVVLLELLRTLVGVIVGNSCVDEIRIRLRQILGLHAVSKRERRVKHEGAEATMTRRVRRRNT